MPFELRWEDPADAAYGWKRYRTGPFTRFYADAWTALHVAKRRCYEETGVPLSREHVFRMIDGWPYIREPRDDQHDADERFGRFHAYATRVPDYYAGVVRPEVVSLVELLRRHPRPTAPLPDLYDHLEACVQAHAHVMGNLHWRMVFGGQPLDWPAVFHKLTGEPPAQASVLLSGTRNEAAKLVGRLRALAGLVQTDPALQAAVETRDVRALRAHPDTAVFKRFRTSFRTLLRRYGQRSGQGWGSAAAVDAPTWNMRPEIPLGMVASYARSDLTAIARREKAAASERQRLLQRIQRSLRGDPAAHQRFEGARRHAIRNAFVMEDHNHWMDQCVAGVMREALDVVGRRLVRDGHVYHADDALHLSLHELRDLSSGADAGDLRTLIDERRRRYAEQQTYDPPKTIGESAPPDGPSFSEEGEGLDGRVLRGIAASAGRYTGRAHVAARTAEPPDVQEGDVLVAPDAGPAWTPVFALLGALVLDRGAGFQHAAVMAREFGIPAVLGTKQATSAIADGQTVTVDGDAGVVEL